MTSSDFSNRLIAACSPHSNFQLAERQSAYMRNLFPFIGINATERRGLARTFLNPVNRPDLADWQNNVLVLWSLPEREYQYIGQELAEKYVKHFKVDDIPILEFMVTNKSWWDTVDFIASHLLGSYFARFPEQIPTAIDTWLASDNMWLQRSAIIFQLKYKARTDTELLGEIIRTLADSPEFFIRKAIGWALREYGKNNPEWVIDFVGRTKLSGLSKREALRIIEKRNLV